MRGSGLIKDLFFYIQNFGFNKAFKIRIYPILLNALRGGTVSSYQNAEILRILRKDMAEVIKKYKHLDFKQNKIAKDAPIWVCWWQGELNMPPIIRECYKRLIENSNGHPVRLITEQNVNEYFTPPYIFMNV